MNIAVLRRLMSAVLLAGLMAGLLLTAVQRVQVTDIILQAEVYEEAAAKAAEAAPHEHAVETAAHDHGHDHEHDEGWEPANGVERISWTVVANVVMAVGFGLFLAAAMVLSGRNANWRTGLLWGVAGYIVFFVAPSLGLHPEVPGTQAAPVNDRQLWWLMTAAATAGGLACIVFGKNLVIKIVGAVMLVVPHLIGAPHLAVEHSAAPEELAQAFIVATAIANAIFWLVLGGLTGFFYRKFG